MKGSAQKKLKIEGKKKSKTLTDSCCSNTSMPSISPSSSLVSVKEKNKKEKTAGRSCRDGGKKRHLVSSREDRKQEKACLSGQRERKTREMWGRQKCFRGINTEEHNGYEGPPESQQMRKNEGIEKYTSSQVIPCRPEHYTTHLCFSADPTGAH